MRTVGHVESLWRYPVKSMRGEQLREAFVGFPGIYGDRCFAVRSSASPKAFPYLTGRELQQLLLYQPAYRSAEHSRQPLNLADAEALGPGITPLYADPADLMVDVETPTGEKLAIDDPRLIGILREQIRATHELSLLRSERALTDCRPISLFSVQTERQLSRELGTVLEKLRFRANIYADLETSTGFGEDQFVGRTLQIGAKVMVAILERDPRCKMITLDPNSGQADPEVMRLVARDHEGKAGVYGAVLVEGTIRPGDAIALVN